MSDTPLVPVKTPSPGIYRLDPDHSSAGFAVMHKVSKFRGSFAHFDATLEVSPGGDLSLAGSADVRSLLVKNTEQSGHLQSPEFFDAARHPSITFRSSSIALASDNAISLTGDLTVRGQTRPIEATGVLTFVEDDLHGRARVGMDLAAEVDRTAFGLVWNQALPGGGFAVADDVTLTVELELPKVA